MIGIGLAILVIAVVLIILGIANAAIHTLLWVGVVLLAVGAVVALVGRNRRTPLE